MEMNIASAQQVIRETDGPQSTTTTTMNGLPTQAAAALSEARANLEFGASSIASAIAPAVNAANGATSIQNGLSGAQAERLQLIDENQKFNPEVGTYLEKWGLEEAGFNYNLCAVVGSQSTGKSTLLNKLFGTTFDVMKENERRQTTKGE